MTANLQERYVTEDGRLTIAGAQLFDGLHRRMTIAENKLKAIAAVAEPTGGTPDAEARTAINEIIAGAG